MRKQALVFVFSILLIGIFGCRREMNLASWDTDLLAPAAHGSINFYNYLPEENFVEESGNLIHLVAEDTLISLGLDTLIGIPDYSIDTGFFFPLSIPVQPGQPFFVDTSETTFDLKDVRLTEAIIRNSRIRVDIRNTLDQDVLFQYSIESASIDGDTFRVSERIDGNSSFSKEYDLNGYTLNLRGLKQNKVNTVATTIVAMVHPDLVGTQQLKAGDRFDISNTVTNVIPEYVTGYFGNQVAEFNESEGLDVFDLVDFESVDITEFSLDLIVDNGIGADLGLDVREISSSNSETGDFASLNHEIVGSPQQFTRAIDLGNEQNPVKHQRKVYSFTHENSNLDELLELKPNSILADVAINVNPLGNVSLGNDFAYYGHNLSAYMQLDIPLIVAAKGVSLVDTIDFSFDSQTKDEAIERLNSGFIRAYLSNDYPIDGTLQFSFLDSNKLVLFDLFETPSLVLGAEVNANDDVIPTRSQADVPIDSEKIELLGAAHSIKVTALLSTTGVDAVRLTSGQKIDYRLVVDVNARVN